MFKIYKINKEIKKTLEREIYFEERENHDQYTISCLIDGTKQTHVNP